MSETNDTSDKAGRTGTGGAPRKPLSLKRTVESGHVQQKFSHGRAKTVVVEKKKRRTIGGAEVEEAPAPAVERPAPRVASRPTAAPPATPSPAAAEPARTGAVLRTLSEEERVARERALAASRVRDAESERLRAEQARLDAIEAEHRRAEEAASPPKPAPAAEPETRTEAAPAEQPPATAPSAAPAAPPETAASRPAVAQTRTAASGAARAPSGAPRSDAGAPARPRPSGGSGAPTRLGAPVPSGLASSTDTVLRSPVGMTRPQRVDYGRSTARPAAEPVPPKKAEIDTPRRPVRPATGVAPATPDTGDDDDAGAKKKGSGVKVTRSPVKGGETRERTKLTVYTALNQQQRERSLASLKRKREREKLKAMGIPQSREKIVREVIIPEAITIQELSNRMTERAVDLIKLLMKQGAMHKITDVIDADTAELIVTEFGHTPKRVSEADVEEGFIRATDETENLVARAPVVTIMGHVDHGKTSLLDAIRSANVAAGEAGGITQHIGAYQVTTPDGKVVTFIDTPGHEAFTAMRARGAKVTDIVILVVAADDGVMPQTVEAINHAKSAGVPIIVAINKIDKPDADPTRVATELLQHEIVVESMSGETLDVPVSATKRMNLDKLLEAISLQAELLDLKANPARSAEGFVIEAKLERGRGPVGTLLVQRGTLHVGDIVVAGSAWGRVRAMLDDQGKAVKEAGPSVPAEVLGFDSAPEAGDQFAVVESEARAREITDYRVRKRRETLGSAGTPRTLEAMMQSLKDAAGRKEFNLLIKGDVQGSVEAIAMSLKKIGNEEVEARIVHSGVGSITESDIALANASKAVVIGFNVRANAQAKQAADQQGVEIRYYSIIYDLVDEVKAAMSGLLAPTKKEVFLGYASIKQVFNISKVGKVAGCQVTQGKVERGAKVRLLRDKVVIHEGTLSILKRFKDEVKEVPAGQECGMAFANYQDIRENDEIECFQVETIQRSL